MITLSTEKVLATNKRTMMDGNLTSHASKRLTTIVAVLTVCVGLVGTPQSYGAGVWTNEPSGFSTLVDCPFSGSLCAPIWNAYNTEAYTANGTAFDTYLAAGSAYGNGQWGVDLPNVREIFVGLLWNTNPEFQGLFVNSNKMFFIGGNDNNNLMSWMGGQDAPRQLRWVLQQTTMNNCHIPSWSSPGCSNPAAGPGSGSFNPNGSSSGWVTAGDGWHKIEVYQKASTTPTSRDGTIRMWLDGILLGDYPGVNVAPEGFNFFQINHAWDGSAGLVAPNRDMNRAWHHYWDHLRISVGNGTAPADQPPGPPASPRIIGVTAP